MGQGALERRHVDFFFFFWAMLCACTGPQGMRSTAATIFWPTLQFVWVFAGH